MAGATMNVLQFMASCTFGGAENVFIELSNSLAARHRVTALLPRNCSFRNRFHEQVAIVELQANPTRHNPFLLIEIFKLLKKLRPDIIHTHAAKGSELIAAANKYCGFNHLATKHNDRNGRIFNSLPWVSAVSQKGKHSVTPQPRATVRVISNGVVEASISPGNSADIFTMLAVGRLDPIKGFDELIRQAATLQFPYKLLIVGEGPARGALEKLIAKLDLSRHVELLGFRDDVPQLMNNSNMVVISSHREGGPKVMIEAMYYAPLLLSTPVGSVPEVLSPMFQSSLEYFGASITRLYNTYEASLQVFKAICEEKKAAFSHHEVVRQYEEYYNQIIASL